MASIQKQPFNELVIACDFETHTIYNEQNQGQSWVVAFACKEVYKQVSTWKIDVEQIEEINNKVFYFDTLNLDLSAIKKFFDYLFSFKDYLKVNIFFHNLKNFDGFFLVPYLLENFEQLTLDFKIDDTIDNTFQLLYVNNFLLNIRVKKDNVVYNFIDSLSFFPRMPLKSLGDIINLPKLDFNDQFDILVEKPLNSQRYLDFVTYTKRDTEILAKFLLFFVDKTKINLTTSISAAGISFTYFKQKYYKKGMFLSSQDQWHIIQQSYYGGFTYLNDKYALKVLNNLNYFDINSAYPTVLKQPLPYGDLQIFKNQKYGAKLLQIRIKKLEINELDIAIIRSKKYNERFIKKADFPFIYYIWDFELEYVKKFYKVFKYEILETYWIKLKKIADNFIDYWYEIKQKNAAKATPEQKLFNYFSKVVLNSLYGKFGEKIVKPQRYYIQKEKLKENPEEILLYNKLYHIKTKHGSKIFKNLIEVTLIPESPKINKIKNNAIASYVTAKVRVELYKQILKHKNTFVYCDTDSIILKDESIEEYFLSEDILGLWKVEHKNVQGYFIQPKQYFLKTKDKLIFKTAGFQHLLSDVDFEKIHEIRLIFEKLSSKKSAYGVVLTPQQSELIEGQWNKIRQTLEEKNN